MYATSRLLKRLALMRELWYTTVNVPQGYVDMLTSLSVNMPTGITRCWLSAYSNKGLLATRRNIYESYHNATRK